MRQDQDKQIEQACAAMASALARLVAAVQGQAAAATTAGSTTRVMSDALGGALRSAVNEPIANACGESYDRIKPRRRIDVYLAGSSGRATLARTYGTRIMAALGLDTLSHQVGTTAINLAERLRQIGQDRYGTALRTKNGIEIESGFAAWIAHTISTSRQPRDPAVGLLPRIIAVELPPGLPRRAFDTALHRALNNRSLASIPGGEVHRHFVACDLIETRISVANELYALSPHASGNGDLLLDAIEDILSKLAPSEPDRSKKRDPRRRGDAALFFVPPIHMNRAVDPPIEIQAKTPMNDRL